MFECAGPAFGVSRPYLGGGALSLRRDQASSVAAVPTRLRDIHGVAKGVPHVAGIDAVLEGLVGRAAIEIGESQLAGKGPGVLRAEDGVKERVKLPEAHSASGGQQAHAGPAR